MTLGDGVDRSVPTYGSVDSMGMDEWQQEELDELARAVIHGVPGAGSEGQVLRVVRGRLQWSNVDELPKLAARADVPSGDTAKIATPGLVSLTVVLSLVGAVNGLLTNQEALRKRVNELQADLKAKGYMADK